MIAEDSARNKCAIVLLLAVVATWPFSVRVLGAQGRMAEGLAPPNDWMQVGGRKFFTGGPVRYAPAQEGGLTILGSDDGYLYALNRSGTVVWKFFGGYSNRKMLLAGRLASAWHVSGGPVAADGKVYFAAGTFPCMGVFVYAIDTKSGKVLWVNDNSDTAWDAPGWRRGSFQSVVPKGQLRISGNELIVPCGRTKFPAKFDLRTGKLLALPRAGGGGGSNNKPYTPEDFYARPDFDRVAESTKDCFPADAMANGIMTATGIREGYCVVLGIGDGRLVEGLIAHSKLRLIVVEPDARKVSVLRSKLDAKRIYGARVSVHEGNPNDFGLPPYIASLIVSGDVKVLGDKILANVFQALRPYGGVLCLPSSAGAMLSAPPIENAKVSNAGALVMLKRTGALPGSDDWSHDTANAGNTRSSNDLLVKSPFGVIWAGGPAEEPTRYYENHRSHGGLPQVTGGRLFVEGPKLVSAFDVYTGRMLWEWTPEADAKEVWAYPLPNIFKQYAYFMFEGMEGRMTTTDDLVYIVSDKTLHVLDSQTGRPSTDFQFSEKKEWGSVKVLGDRLFLPSADEVIALDRHSGKELWRFTKWGGTLAAGKDIVFCLEYPFPDRWPNNHMAPGARNFNRLPNKDQVKRRGMETVDLPSQKLAALDAKTGRELWKTKVSGGRAASNRLMYSAKHDVLIVTGPSHAYRGKDGEELGRRRAGDVSWMWGDYVFQGSSLARGTHLATGNAIQWVNPVTGQKEPFGQNWKKGRPSKGCGAFVAGPHLMTLRSSFASYIDLDAERGIRGPVVNITSFRTGCTSNLMPANGLLVSTNAGSGGCSCRYPLSTAVGMVHMPEMDTWGLYGTANTGGVVRLGINFGAPGDRLTDNGTLWLDYPSVGGASPNVRVAVAPENPEWIRHHSSRVVEGDGLPWVQASGSRNLKSATITLNNDRPRSYRVRIYYAELVSGKPGSLRGIVDEKTNVVAGTEMKLTFEGGKLVCGVEIVDSALAAKEKLAQRGSAR